MIPPFSNWDKKAGGKQHGLEQHQLSVALK